MRTNIGRKDAGFLKKLLAGICCLSMIISACAIPVSSDNEADTAAETEETEEDTAEEESADKDAVRRTDEEAMTEMELVTENDKLALYKNEKAVTFALKDKNTGEIWWSNPINADCSAGKKTQIQELKASLAVTYGVPADRKTVTVNSKVKGKAKFKAIENGMEVTYKFAAAKITVPVIYTLEADYLKVYVDTKQLKEEDGGKIITDLSFLTTFGAAEEDENGYFVIPDGSGAIINFNNGKTNYKVYSGKVYGNDITPVTKLAPAVTEQVYLPVFGIVKGESGMMVVADKGDSCATINAYVAGQKKTSYNTCYFDFELRTDDEFLMGGDVSPLRVFEKRGILVPEIEIRYYPVSKSDKSEISYVDIADKYRNYLMSDCGVTKSETADTSPLYVDFYGGVLKTESILGFPVRLQHETTSFDEAVSVLERLKTDGAENIVVNYNQWNVDDIKEHIADDFSPASRLGGKSGFNRLKAYTESNGISFYPAIDNLTFKTGNGYWTMTSTAIRVSNAFSRQIVYDPAYRVENKFYKALSLLSPQRYGAVSDKLAASYNKNGIGGISLGTASTVLYGDYGRHSTSREMFKYELAGQYAKLDEQVGSVLADGANAYVIPYVDHITNVPLSSSKFDVFDTDIPFYQLVMHGLKPYSATAANGDAQIAEHILKAVAAGSNLHFDLIAEDASELKDTRFDVYYYADSSYWTDDAASCYRFANELLSDVAGQKIVEYNIISDDEIETVYENGTTITVNIPERTAVKNGTVFSLYDYIGREVIG